MTIRELLDPAEVAAACGDDDLLVWVAQGLRGGARAWTLETGRGSAVVAAAPGVSRRDRLGMWGDAACAVPLVRHVLAEMGPSYRPFGERELVREVAARLPGVRPAGRFSWMSLSGAAQERAPAAVAGEVGWLAKDADAQVAALLAAEAPDSYAVPGLPGVSRWAGANVAGELAAVAAEAWSAPTVGLLAGVATRARFRGRGLAERVCRWVTGELLAAYGRAALMVDDENAAAITVYERIGYRRRLVMASHVTA
ncbi:GNAT family N-acetyltransferase [Nonomuraea phyllanthi]|uniref:GNAT family N-acetyltransferase n=1 Tax=Nonomuraea phyllanthi TaxID=2219224 RepID=A0A5C4VHE8_9ACTN|nr:GNAT family N-acetyltransferase [Nonomuraea phyllanthi]KAB8189065.1 GNAT family N-acetyltransferase [Nonomuraea phyllanthi]